MTTIDDTNINTITVPFIPPFDSDVISIEEASKYADRLPEGFELHEIVGTRLVRIDDEWSDIGHKAVFIRTNSGDDE